MLNYEGCSLMWSSQPCWSRGTAGIKLMLIFVEGGKLENPEKNPWGKGGIQQITTHVWVWGFNPWPQCWEAASNSVHHLASLYLLNVMNYFLTQVACQLMDLQRCIFNQTLYFLFPLIMSTWHVSLEHFMAEYSLVEKMGVFMR
jgi:hypothetical protein